MLNGTRRAIGLGLLGSAAGVLIGSRASAQTRIGKAGAGLVPDHVPEKILSPKLKDAWRAHEKRMADIFSFINSTKYSEIASVRSAANETFLQIQAIGYAYVMAQRPDYPCLYTLAIPNIYPAMIPNPDCKYRWSTLSSDRVYRIWGKRGSAKVIDFQLNNYNNFPIGDKISSRSTDNYSIDQFEIRDDGYFEIILSEKEHKGNWISLQSNNSNINLTIRELFYDWKEDVSAELHIEPFDDVSPSEFLFNDEIFINKLIIMGEMISVFINEWGVFITDIALKNSNGITNRFSFTPRVYGTNKNADYFQCVYNIEDDEALIIEMVEPDAKYWGIQLCDAIGNTTEYVYHQSSLNGFQARKDLDGKIRMVIAKRDPGVNNWLDVVDNNYGMAIIRQYYYNKSVPLPKTYKINVKDVVKNLPIGETIMTKSERSSSIRSRRIGILEKYGF